MLEKPLKIAMPACSAKY